MTEFLQPYLDQLHTLGAAGYWVLFLATFGESFVLAGLLMPGTIVLLIMGGLAPYGYYDASYLAVAGFWGALCGNIISYELGRLGRFKVEKIPFIQKRMAPAKKFFRTHGGKSVILCRFVGPVRPILPFVAGVSEMARIPFYAYSVLGSFVWIVTYLSFGYTFGYAWKNALTWSSAAVTAMVVVVVAAYVIMRWWKMKK